MRALLIAVFMMLGSVNAAAGQWTLQDDIDFWVNGLLADRELEFVGVGMVTFPHQSDSEVRRDDSRLVADLRRMGLRALRTTQGAVDVDLATTSIVAAQCAQNEFVDNLDTTVAIATSVYIEIWDHVLARSIPVYRSLQISTVGIDAYSQRDQVESCGDYLSDPLIRLGFER